MRPGFGTGATDQEFGKIMDLVQADGGAYDVAFLTYSGEGVGASEGGDFVRFLARRGEIVHRLHTIGSAEYRVLGFPYFVGRGGMQRPCRRQFLVGIGDGEAALIVLHHLWTGIFLGSVVAEASHIHGKDVR